MLSHHQLQPPIFPLTIHVAGMCILKRRDYHKFQQAILQGSKRLIDVFMVCSAIDTQREKE